MSDERFLTAKEAADALGIKQNRLYALIAAGRLAAVRFGGKAWMIKESDLAAVKERKPGRPAKPKKP